jgi:predicted nucleic acid-binding protein
MSVATVLLDTNVFTAWLRPRSSLLPMYGKHVFGQRIAIAQQTVAEVRYGAVAAGWGERRLEAVERLLHRSRVLPVDDETTWAYARLRHQCRALGHPLHQKQHVATCGSPARRSDGTSHSSPTTPSSWTARTSSC